MAIEDIGKNALQVLEKRYLAKDKDNNHIETEDGLFRRVARAIADGRSRSMMQNADVAALEEQFYELMTSLRFFAKLPHADECGPAAGAAFRLLCAAGGGQHGGDFRDGETGGAHPQIRRRHRLFLLPPPAERRSTVNSTGGVASGPISFMRVFNMATEAVKQGGTRRGREHGHPAGGPSGYPGLHRLQKGQRGHHQFQHFGGHHRGVHAGSGGRTEDYDLIDPQHPGSAVGKLQRQGGV